VLGEYLFGNKDVITKLTDRNDALTLAEEIRQDTLVATVTCSL
jgi:hypothetical protein